MLWIINNEDYYNRRGSDWSTSDVIFVIYINIPGLKGTIEMHIAVSYRKLLVPDREDPGTFCQKLLVFHAKMYDLCIRSSLKGHSKNKT